jgi:predicted nucleotidyltransferase
MDTAAEVALRFVDSAYTEATSVIMGGSASTGRRTASSDIDVLVIASATSFADGRSRAQLVHREGERLDVFAYTEDAFRAWSEKDFVSLRPVLPYLLTEGTPLRAGDDYERLCTWCTDRLAEGPRLSDHDLALRRYAVTDLIDDLVDATDQLEAAATRADLFRALGELLLLSANQWLGSGKWLARRLRAWDEPSAQALLAFAQTPDPLVAGRIASKMLDSVGGRVDADFTR